ncbi:hypothetical protein KP509_1Z179000 [Ceratopteris richardii]|nr:hypothetical protein KP509_1Z179000 [Ceratopteris richardii]
MNAARLREMVTPAREALEVRLDAQAGTDVHIQALDMVINVNALFTAAVFIGIAYRSTGSSGANDGASGGCRAGPDKERSVLVMEVVAFACYLFSSLVAQGIKLNFLLLHSKKQEQQQQPASQARLLRLGMLASALGTVIGTLFLTLSLVSFVQLRLGLLNCTAWPWAATLPLVLMVSLGLLVFISSVLYSFLAD